MFGYLCYLKPVMVSDLVLLLTGLNASNATEHSGDAIQPSCDVL